MMLCFLCLIELISAIPMERDFYSERSQILSTEDSMFYGSNLVLNSAENYANSVLMNHKHEELDIAFQVI